MNSVTSSNKRLTWKWRYIEGMSVSSWDDCKKSWVRKNRPHFVIPILLSVLLSSRGKNSFNLGQCEMPLRNDHINNGFFENTTL